MQRAVSRHRDAERLRRSEVLPPAELHVADTILYQVFQNVPGRSAVELLTQLRHECPGLCVIALSGRSEAGKLALAAGADGFVSKSDPPERLLAALDVC